MENIHFDDRECFVEDISNILQRGSADDIKIKVDNGEIYANKEILAARCEYFKLMFRNRFSEVENNVIDLSYLSKKVVERILSFIFSGKVNFDDMSLIDLMEMAKACDMLLLGTPSNKTFHN